MPQDESSKYAPASGIPCHPEGDQVVGLFGRALENSCTYMCILSHPWQHLQWSLHHGLWALDPLALDLIRAAGAGLFFRDVTQQCLHCWRTHIPDPSLTGAERTVIVYSTPLSGQDTGEIRLPHSGTPHLGCGHRGFQFLWLLLRNMDLFQGIEWCKYRWRGNFLKFALLWLKGNILGCVI